MFENCLYQPTELLAVKLSERSPDLYIFWQNYNQLYTLFSERTIEIESLRRQLHAARTEAALRPPTMGTFEMGQLRQRMFEMEKQLIDLKAENQNYRSQIDKLTITNDSLLVDNHNYQLLLRQFKEENAIQKTNIEDILLRLKMAEENVLTSQSRVIAEELQDIAERSKQTENKYRMALMARETQLHMLTVSIEEMKIAFEKVLVDSMRNLKHKIVEELPQLMILSRNVRHLKEDTQQQMAKSDQIYEIVVDSVETTVQHHAESK